MPTTLPVNFSTLPYAASAKASMLSGISYELVGITVWSLAMLAFSLVAIHHGGLPAESFNLAFQ